MEVFSMPRYSYSNPARRTQAAPATIDRKLERPNAERVAKLDKPSTAKTTHGIARKSSDAR